MPHVQTPLLDLLQRSVQTFETFSHAQCCDADKTIPNTNNPAKTDSRFGLRARQSPESVMRGLLNQHAALLDCHQQTREDLHPLSASQAFGWSSICSCLRTLYRSNSLLVPFCCCSLIFTTSKGVTTTKASVMPAAKPAEARLKLDRSPFCTN